MSVRTRVLSSFTVLAVSLLLQPYNTQGRVGFTGFQGFRGVRGLDKHAALQHKGRQGSHGYRGLGRQAGRQAGSGCADVRVCVGGEGGQVCGRGEADDPTGSTAHL